MISCWPLASAGILEVGKEDPRVTLQVHGEVAMSRHCTQHGLQQGPLALNSKFKEETHQCVGPKTGLVLLGLPAVVHGASQHCH